MCGIAGRASDDGLPLPRAVIDNLRHRGPENVGIRTWARDQHGWELAHTRLAIVDLTSDANEPLPNEDETLWMVFNGEIYNSPELRAYCEAKGHRFRSRCDGEVILHLWEMENWRCLRRLNGIFALAIADERTGTVSIARDPVGVKPLYYVQEGRTLGFASELRALEALGIDLGKPDVLGLAQFLTFLWSPDPRTPFSNACSLPPGRVLQWVDGRTSMQTFVDLVAEAGAAPTLAMPTKEETAERIEAAVRRQLLSDVPIGLLASGGIDSSLIWWAARDQINRAFTIDWSSHSGDERNDEDAASVRLLEQRFETTVDYLPGEETAIGFLPRSGDLFADPAFELTRRISAHAKAEGFKVLLSGQGGDEVFGGYRRHQMAKVVGRLRTGALGQSVALRLGRQTKASIRTEYVARIARASSRAHPLHSYLELCSYSTPADRARVLGCTEAEVSDERVWQRHAETYDRLPADWSLLRKMRAVDFAVYLPGLGLAYADRAGMEHSIEVRVPWLDLDLVRWALRLPDAALIHGLRSKWLTRQVAADVLPSRIARRPKRGFGVPASMLPATGQGERGFRQSGYLAIATQLLEEHLHREGTPRPAARRLS